MSSGFACCAFCVFTFLAFTRFGGDERYKEILSTMDKIPPGAGMPGGAGIDGAFERFLTAAIATIITIMFSWRLLAEEEEAMGVGGAGSRARSPRPFSMPSTYRPVPQIQHKNTPNVLQQTTAQRSTANICEIDISDDESGYNYRESRSTDVDQIDRELVVYDQCSPEQQQQLEATMTAGCEDTSLSSAPNTDDSLTLDTLTTWDEYKWEEETGQEEECVIKTRRSLRDFGKNQNCVSPNSHTPNTSTHTTPVLETSLEKADANVTHTVPFTQRFADFVPDAGGDSGYIDLYPDVESDSDVTDSSDDERVYEIQVSDSDSDSDGDVRNGSFYGVKSLDTIMEEYESDVSEPGDVTDNQTRSKQHASVYNAEQSNVVCETDELLTSCNVPEDNSSDCDNISDTVRSDNDNRGNYTETDIDTGVSLKSDTNVTKTEGFSATTQTDGGSICQPTDTPFSSSEASRVKYNLPLDRTSSSNVNTDMPVTLMGKNLQPCESSVNQDSHLHSPVSEINPHSSLNQLSMRPYSQPTDADENSSPIQGCSSTNNNNSSNSKPTKYESMNLKLSADDYKISEISDDSLPPSPVRTCALDNLADEPFSDTESCSSGSVITVLSMRSTDSENRASDKINFIPVSKGDPASGNNETPMLLNNQNTTNINSKYDNFSLVSGFLNDSLNSLLSANTGSEVSSSSDLESSGPDIGNQRELAIHESNVHVNGKTTSDDSNVSSNESLPFVQELVHANEQIPVTDNLNGHTTSSDSLDNVNSSQYSSMEPIQDYVDSDASSDSSDPPLREYDPRDDDLAAFQFNLDSDDDSFFLVMGGESDDSDDEGKLRNFETFTNLNSVGLAADYGDAVASRTLADDGKSFTFSHTENVDTEFKRRGYFTERDNATDSPNRGPLSPVLSEDEEPKPEELSPTGSRVETIATEAPITSSTYDDAECSMPSKGNDSLRDSAIDFNKYIIKSDLSPVSKNFPDFPAQNGKSSATVDETNSNDDRTSIIDKEGDKMNNSGERVLNYSEAIDRPTHSLSSLIDPIENAPDTDWSSEHGDNLDLKEDSNSVCKQSESDEKSTPESGLKATKIETNIDDLFDNENELPTDTSEIETLIDDIFGSIDDNSFTEDTNIDEIVTKSTEKKTKFVQPKTIKRSHRRSTPVKEAQSKLETNIDDIFTAEVPRVEKVETNIDDIFEPELAHVTPVPVTSSAPRKETNVGLPDVVCDVNRSVDVQLETCFDVTSDISGDVDYKDFVHNISSHTDKQPEITSESAISGVNEPRIPEKGVHVENDQISEHNENKDAYRTQIERDSILNQDSESRLQQNIPNTAVSDIDTLIDCSIDNLDLQTKQKQAAIPHSEQTINAYYTPSCEQNDSHGGYDGIDTNNGESSERDRQIIARNLDLLAHEPNRSDLHTDRWHKQNNRDQLVRNLNPSYSDDTYYNANVSVPTTEILNSGRSSNLPGSVPEDKANRLDSITDNSTEQTNSAANLVDLGQELSQQNADLSGNKADLIDASKGISFHDVEDSIVNEYADDENNETDELKIDEDSFVDAVEPSDDTRLDSLGSCSLDIYSDDESLSSFEESYNNIQATYNAIQAQKLAYSPDGRVVRTPLQKPSELFSGRSKELKGVKRRVHKHQVKKYQSVLQQPVTPERTYVHIELPDRPASVSRLNVQKSRERFLSEENLTSDTFEDKFLKHRTALVASTPRKYLKRHERDLQSTESLPTEMSLWNTSYGSNLSMDQLHGLTVQQRIDEVYNSRYSSHNSSFEHDKLHANCIFSPGKREEIQHSAKSLENMFEQLLRYGSVSSVAETDLDAPDYEDPFISFQFPLERAASMSALFGTSDVARTPKKTGKGRFANRKVPKSKSLQTLETNLDDVFASELEHCGEMTKSPSVHELRVSKSLSKLHVPDWFKKSSFSRAGSTQSLFNYAGRTGSTSTLGSYAYPPSLASSPTPSVTPGGNTVIIQKRVTPSPTVPTTSKLLRSPMLPTTPERSPIHDLPSTILPSDKYRKQKTECKSLKPITILPFAKLREMFEKKAQADAATANSPTREKPSPTKDFPRGSPTKGSPTKGSPTKEKQRVHFDTAQIPTISEPTATVENKNGTTSPPPPLPERKPILTDTSKQSESSNSLTRKQQVHFSDEKIEKKVSKPQEQKVDSKRQNGSTPSTSSSTVKKPSGLRAALPLPNFFRRPGSYATKVAASNTQATTQSKKGKHIDFYDDYGDNGVYQVNHDISVNTPPPAWLHVLELKAKTDGETLFEFLQKRRYSSILENGFAEQMDELQDKDVIFNFPVMAVSNHSSNGDMYQYGSPDLRVVLTNAHNHAMQNGFLDNKLRNDVPVDEILDGLLLLEGHQTGRMKMGGNGKIVPKSPDSPVLTPDTPPGFAFLHPGHVDSDEALYGPYDSQSEYILVKCENPHCHRETNLREAKEYFKSCHSCFTYYCSRKCRKIHWSPHKRVCVYSRINSACKHVIKFINKQPHVQYQCSRIARRGYLSQGRGCVVFAFPDIGSAEEFLTSGMESLWVPPVYIGIRELPNATMLGSQLNTLTETCKQYNPELKYVIHVAIVIPQQLPYRPIPRRMDSIIQKCAKLRLSPAHMHPKQDDSLLPSTLILTAVPGNQHADDTDGRKTRELCFVNIQRKLRQRDVSLRHQFPNVYNKLIDFVSDAKHFSPLIIYPTDGRSGKRFMCVIMPEAEPEIEWIRDPDLFHELDVFEDEDTETSSPSYTIQLEVML